LVFRSFGKQHEFRLLKLIDDLFVTIPFANK